MTVLPAVYDTAPGRVLGAIRLSPRLRRYMACLFVACALPSCPPRAAVAYYAGYVATPDRRTLL